MADTIYALATPPGKGGIAVIRVSGPRTFESLQALTNGAEFESRQAAYRTFKNPETGEVIDHGVAVPFKGPKCFTGEDTVEYSLHGGMAIVHQMLDVLSKQKGHRLALPGEFTRRAFENGKLDLTAAEAIADLIDAETTLQKAQALEQLEGGLSKIYQGWTDELKNALAHLEADLEFPDEEMPDGVTPKVTPVLKEISDAIKEHLNDNRRGERLRDGLHVVVIGAPNAGKSSLVNALSQRDVAIVSEQAGTTRDVIEVHLDLGGYPVILSDTAGLRPEQLSDKGQDAIESEGIRRALERAQNADLKLLIFDATALPALDEHTKDLAGEASLIVFNKCDEYQGKFPDEESIQVSAQTGEGLEDLTDRLTQRIDSLIGTREAPSLTRQRHRENLEQCYDALTRALNPKMPELAAEDVRLAVRYLGHITGRVDVEDLLDVIFRDFCIGK